MGLEETELIPLIGDEVPVRVIEHIKEEHGKAHELAIRLEGQIGREFEPLETMETLSELRGLHASHIHLENQYFYPLLDKLRSSKAEEILERFEEKSFEDYVPLVKRD